MRQLTAILSLLMFLSQIACAEPTERATAREIDQLLARHFQAADVIPTGPARDEDLLRRLSLDLAGVIPRPGQITLVGLDPNPEKFSRLIDELLESPRYGELWARYWGDVIFSRATEQRVRLVQPAFQSWMQQALNENRPWNEIVADLITARGSVATDGQTGLIFAHTGNPEELAAEISRVFLGIQLSCANCHDHPTDSWKREQFHQLAAFLPRISVRPETPGEIRTFQVKSYEGPSRRGMLVSDAQRMRFLDRNGDGKLSREEARGPLVEQFDFLLSYYDRDKDGLLSLEELQAARQQGESQPGRGAPEYYMPDLDDPASQGQLMAPAFFLTDVSGRRVRPGSPDAARRQALAEYVTSRENPWFARALVNRVWSEMLGRGFYQPVDDIGPERSADCEDVLQLLSERFVANGHDMKWLLRTIALTDAYQRALRPTAGDDAAHVPFAQALPVRLRSDQIYNAIFEVLGVDPPRGPSFRSREMMLVRGRGPDAQRAAFSALFGFDPSTAQEDLLGNVPQALFLMNSPQLTSQLRGVGSTRLARLLREHPDDGDALREIYLMTLGREPTEREFRISAEYGAAAAGRSEHFEDVLWALLNSTEFLSRR